MPSSKAVDIARRFSGTVGRLDRTRQRADAAFLGSYLRVRDLEVFYCGLFLQLIVAYEATLEEFVLGLIVKPGGIRSSVAGVSGRVQVRSYAHALALAAGPKKDFAEWISKEQLKKSAELLLRSGMPFSTVNPNHWDAVEKARFIRNAIAHPSESAKSKFDRLVVGSTPLPRTERSVGGYLRGAFSVSPPQSRWELYAASLDLFVSTYVK